MGHNSFQFDFFLRKIGTVQRFQPAPYPFDTDPLSPCGFRQTAPAQTLTDLKADSFKAVRPMVRALKDLDKETREALLKFMSILFMSNLRMTLEGIQEETEKSLLRNGKKAERSAGKKG